MRGNDPQRRPSLHDYLPGPGHRHPPARPPGRHHAGATAVDPRSYDADFWTLVVGGERRPGTGLEAVLASFEDPGIEVEPERSVLRIYEEEGD